jgi:hypothetical protein
MEIWGYCRDCDRWFYCSSQEYDNPDWHCPVCGAEPVALENRAPRDKPDDARD